MILYTNITRECTYRLRVPPTHFIVDTLVFLFISSVYSFREYFQHVVSIIFNVRLCAQYDVSRLREAKHNVAL